MLENRFQSFYTINCYAWLNQCKAIFMLVCGRFDRKLEHVFCGQEHHCLFCSTRFKSSTNSPVTERESEICITKVAQLIDVVVRIDHIIIHHSKNQLYYFVFIVWSLQCGRKDSIDIIFIGIV